MHIYVYAYGVLLLTAPLWQAQGYTGKHACGIQRNPSRLQVCFVVGGERQRAYKPGHVHLPAAGGPGASSSLIISSLAQSQT